MKSRNGPAPFPKSDSTPQAAAPLPRTRLPFPGFRHLGGVLAGLSAGLLAVLLHKMDEAVSPLAVGLCTLGALNGYLLSLLNRSLGGSIVVCAGGFMLGLLGFLASSLGLPPPHTAASFLDKLGPPLLFIALVPLLGAGPVALVMCFQHERPSGTLVRLFLGVAAGGLAALAGVVVFGMLSTFEESVPWWVTVLASFLCADYLLFRLQLACLLEAAPGGERERPAPDGHPLGAPASGVSSENDDEP